MKYIGMPLGMWFLLKNSFCNNLVLVLGMRPAEAKRVTKQAKSEYKRIISKLPAFEKRRPIQNEHCQLRHVFGILPAYA